MTNWINVAKVDDFPVNSWRVVDIADKSILIFHMSDGFYAIENVCTHDGGVLSTGQLIGDEIICPRHGARFCVRTGAVTQPPAYEDVTTYPVRVHEGLVQIQNIDE